MIIKNGKNISAIFKGSTPISKVYKGLQLIWENFKTIIKSGATFFNINSAGENLIDYKIYGNSAQDGTPTPDIPAQIESVGNKTKNLASDGLDPIKIASNRQRFGFNFGVLPAGDYTFSFELGEGGTFPEYLYFFVQTPTDAYPVANSTYHVTTTVVRRNPMTFTADGINRYFILMASNADDSIDKASASIALAKNYMLEKGSSKTDYEPNGYKIKTINYTNLFDIEQIANHESIEKTEEGYYSVTRFACVFTDDTKLVQDLKKYLQPNVTYILSKDIEGCERLASAEGQVRIADNNGEIILRTSNANGFTTKEFSFTQEQIDSIASVYVYGNSSHNPIIYKSIQIGEGSSEYRPFVEPVVQEIYLKEPLRKIGTYIDRLDYANKKIIRAVRERRFEGSEGWLGSTTTEGEPRYSYLLDDCARGDKSASLCNMYKWVSANAQNNSFVIGSSTTYFYVRDDLYQDVTSWKAYLQEIYMDGKPLIACYPLATTVEESIDLPSIPTFEGSSTLGFYTTIMPSDVEITYKGKQ